MSGVASRDRELEVLDGDSDFLVVAAVPGGELKDLRDPAAAPRRFPDVCGATVPATFHFLPATGVLGC